MNLEKLTASLTLNEGSKPAPYRDSQNLWTVGIGRCLERNPITTEEWKWLLDNKAIDVKLTEQGTQYLLSNDVRAAVMSLKSRSDFWDRVDDSRQNILVEMCFQLGIEGLLKFNKMLAAIRIGDYTQAAIEGLSSVWAKQTPTRAKKLMNALKLGIFP